MVSQTLGVALPTSFKIIRTVPKVILTDGKLTLKSTLTVSSIFLLSSPSNTPGIWESELTSLCCVAGTYPLSHIPNI